MKMGDEREEKKEEKRTQGSRAVTTPRRCDAAPLRRHAVGAPCRCDAVPLLPREPPAGAGRYGTRRRHCHKAASRGPQGRARSIHQKPPDGPNNAPDGLRRAEKAGLAPPQSRPC